jgi:hypothetical protein
VADSPCPRSEKTSDERLTVEGFAIVVGDRMDAAGWTKDSHGKDLRPECSPRWLSGQ